MTISTANASRSEKMRGNKNGARALKRNVTINASREFLDMLRDELGYANFQAFERITLDTREVYAFEEWEHATWSDEYPRVFVTREDDPIGAVWKHVNHKREGFFAVWRDANNTIHADDKLHDTARDAFARAMELSEK